MTTLLKVPFTRSCLYFHHIHLKDQNEEAIKTDDELKIKTTAAVFTHKETTCHAVVCTFCCRTLMFNLDVRFHQVSRVVFGSITVSRNELDSALNHKLMA